ncbi:MAG: hypothetical protein ACRBN8_46010 [Nannocystales bacterium]
MTPAPWIQRTALALTLVAFGCDSADDAKTKAAASDKKPAASKDKAAAKAESAKAEPAKAKPPKAEPKAEPEPAKGTVVLEEAELEGLGKIKMPKGYKKLHEKGWKYDLGDFKSISVSWEPHGAKSLKEAKKLSKVLANAPTEKTAETLESGYHEIERVRDSDGFSFVAVFSDSWYVKCSAPLDAMEHCRDIVRSKE